MLGVAEEALSVAACNSLCCKLQRRGWLRLPKLGTALRLTESQHI